VALGLDRRGVESRMGAGTDAERRPVSHPRSSNRTCPFRASGFPTGFIADSRTRGPWPLEPEYPQGALHPLPCRNARIGLRIRQSEHHRRHASDFDIHAHPRSQPVPAHGDTPIWGSNEGNGDAILAGTGALLSDASVGVFGYTPIATTHGGPASFEGLVIGQYDSNTGASRSTMTEFGLGPTSVGYEDGVTNNSSDLYVFTGLTPPSSPVTAGVLTSPTSGTFGFFVGIGDSGIGVY